MKARYATAELVSKEAQTTLTVLLAGVGGSAAYAAKLFEPVAVSPISAASAAVCIYLVVLSVLLVTRCMVFEGYPALYQNPKNLMQPAYTLEQLREAELANLEERIEEAIAINNIRARRLNRVRLAAALSPVVFLVVALLSPKGTTTAAPEKFSIQCGVEPSASGPASVIKCDGVK